MAAARPAWQTDELDEEWVEPDSSIDEPHTDDFANPTNLTGSSVSLTIPIPSSYATNQDRDPTTSFHAGTFLIREDVNQGPLLPKTPGHGRTKSVIKDFFTPLPLERMFEPPSPPAGDNPSLPRQNLHHSPSPLAQERRVSASALQNTRSNEKRSLGQSNPANSRFTFSMPRISLGDDEQQGGNFPQAQSTPGPSRLNQAAPNTDPRLRLFQFQYDTFTRDHLSAMVDSIAVNTPSAGSAFGSSAAQTPLNLGRGLSRVTEANDTSAQFRSAKRVKLSPRSDYYGEGDGVGVTIGRPKVLGKDYVGESQNLMAQIKQARDFSTVSTVPSTSTPQTSHIAATAGNDDDEKMNSSATQLLPTRSMLNIPSGNNPTIRGTQSPSTILQQAATLMAQIKHDMKGQRRIFSGDTDVTHTTSHFDEKSRSRPSTSTIVYSTDDHQLHSHRRHSSTTSNPANHQAPCAQPLRPTWVPDEAIVDGIFNLDLHASHSTNSTGKELVKVARATDSDTPLILMNVRSAAHPVAGSTEIDSSCRPIPSQNSAHPSYSVRSGTAEDLNRFVSSSTASGGTALTSASIPSFVKHAGGPASSTHAQLRRIGPEDIPPLPDRVGNMVLDPVMMKWVKSTTAAGRRDINMTGGTDASDDPFKDIESLREESSSPVCQEEIDLSTDAFDNDHRMSRIEEQTEEDIEERDLNSFSFDDPSSVGVQVMTEGDTEAVHHEITFDSEEEDAHDRRILETTATDFATSVFDSSSEDLRQHSDTAVPLQKIPAVIVDHYATPNRPSCAPAIRSVLKANAGTPMTNDEGCSHNYYVTPAPKKGHRRSVSFSDGKRDGQIRGLGRNADSSGSIASDSHGLSSSSEDDQSHILLPSARSKRIADMMEALEYSELDESQSLSTVATGMAPSASGSKKHRRPVSEGIANTSKAHTPRRVLSRTQSRRLTPRRHTVAADANATFLTECSFAVAHDKLVQIITDVQPFEPYWEDLSAIDLSSKNVESVARLKEFLPCLDSLSLNSNQLCWLSGIPNTVRTLSVSSNCLTGLTSYSHLQNLEHLDISNNDVDSLLQLSCLRHLRELRADSNKIVSMDGLQKMDGLVKLSLQGNCMRNVSFGEYRLSRLEMLNLSRNRLGKFSGLGSLPSLIALNVDDNVLAELEVTALMPRMRILRASGNRLQELDVGLLTSLRTLYVDNNSLSKLTNVDHLTKLENLSVRNQGGKGLTLLTRDVRDAKRLYMSGNPIKTGFLREACYNLVYLELAACRITRLPEELAKLVPNVRVLNLNYNFLEDARCLEGMARLKKLSIIGSRLKGTRSLVQVLSSMPDVEMVDFRMNPCTLGWYLPLLVKDIPGALQPSDGNGEDAKGKERLAWQELDAKFRRDLPDDAYIGRLAYRGLVMAACGRIRMLDGVEVTEKERVKAQRLLEGIRAKRGA